MLNHVLPGGALLLSVLLLSCADGGATEEVGNPGIWFHPRNALAYDAVPLRLLGGGLSLLSPDDLLKFEFEPPLVQGDVLAKLSVESDSTINLQITRGKRWPNAGGYEAPQPLVLKEAFYGDVQLIENPITVAMLIPTPMVSPSANMLFLHSSPHVKIDGTNFNEKSTKLYFHPRLEVGTDVSIFVESPTTIWVTLTPKTEGERWAEEPGPLKVNAIDTGAGVIVLRNEPGGTTIAEMQADTTGHGISVENDEETSLSQSDYESIVIPSRERGFSGRHDTRTSKRQPVNGVSSLRGAWRDYPVG